jgi:hypothetical protein
MTKILIFAHTPYGITLVIHGLAVRARQLACVAQFVRTLHRNRRAAGSIPPRGPIVTFFATACSWLGLINV